MDKWDEMTSRIQQGFLAEEPEAVMAATFGLLAEFGRVFEQLSADVDRMATALEGQLIDVGEPGPRLPENPPLDL